MTGALPLWAPEQAREGITALLEAVAGASRVADLVPEGSWLQWLERGAGAVGRRVVAVELAAPELEATLRRGEAVVATPQGLLLLGRASDGWAEAIGPGGERRRIEVDELRAWLERVRPPPGGAEALLAELGVARSEVAARARRWDNGREREQSTARRQPGVWLLRPASPGSLGERLRQARVPGRLGALLGLGVLQSAVAGVSWLKFGESSLGGTLDAGRFHAMSLGLLTAVALQALSSLVFAELTLRVTLTLRDELFRGALAMPLDGVRGVGLGSMLGRVNEAAALDGLLLSGGMVVLGLLGDLAATVGLLRAGSTPWVALVGLSVVLVAVLIAGGAAMGAAVAQARTRIALSAELVEAIVGHRTRLAQEQPGRWHLREETLLQGYLEATRRADLASLLLSVLPRLAVVGGVALVIPVVLEAPVTGVTMLLAMAAATTAGAALQKVATLFQLAASLQVVWASAGPLLRAAAGAEEATVAPVLPASAVAPGQLVVAATGLRFGHEGRGEMVLDGVSLEIRGGERLLLEGPSGAGKSTLAAVLAGLRVPGGGALLVRGLDHHTLPPRDWRRVVAVAPQFHENHVLSATLAFNLMLGRGWPASAADLTEATELCHELGLGPLLGQMPSGLHQMVGETGWQLSHGEKSRVFLARALLQDPDLVIFDESFAALDPATLEQVLATVLRRSRALLVIAHP